MIENDYFTNVRSIIYGGGYKTAGSRTRKHVNSVSHDNRPYSANLNGALRGDPNPYFNSDEDVQRNTEYTDTEPLQKVNKKRPKTGKARSMHQEVEEEKYLTNEYGTPPKSSKSIFFINPYF